MIVLLKYNFLRVKFIYLIKGLFSLLNMHILKSQLTSVNGGGV